jgi:hypothetical protein
LSHGGVLVAGGGVLVSGVSSLRGGVLIAQGCFLLHRGVSCCAGVSLSCGGDVAGFGVMWPFICWWHLVRQVGWVC